MLNELLREVEELKNKIEKYENALIEIRNLDYRFNHGDLLERAQGIAIDALSD